MNRLKLINLGLALTLIKTLTFSEVNEEERPPMEFSYEEEVLKEEKTYFLKDLELVSVSDSLGNVGYYFVEDNGVLGYQSITHSNKIFANTIPNLKETGYYWVPDVNTPISVVNSFDFLLMQGYDTTKKYTKEELLVLEDTFSSFSFNPFLWIKDSTFAIEDLFIIGDGYHFSIYDRHFQLKIEEKDRTVLYYFNLMNFKQALKCSYGISLEEEKRYKENNDTSYLNTIYIEKETSLYQNQEEKTFFTYDIDLFLTEEQKERGFLYQYEIEEITKRFDYEENEIVFLALK